MKRRFVTITAAAAMILAAPAWADTPVPLRDFTFKRVKPPKKGAVKRITVQIDPVEQRAILAAREQAEKAALKPRDDIKPPPVPAVSGMEWYWAGVSPKLADAGAGRLALAVARLGEAPAGSPVLAPRVQVLEDIAKAHGTEILTATVGTRVSPALVLAVIGVESSGRPGAVSSAGAQGLMQLMPDTAKRFGVADSTVAGDNIKGGVAYLDWLMKKFKGDPVMVLAAYNAGENAVLKNAGVPPFAETRAYVPKVLAAWKVARDLCLTPPDLLSDGCVFAAQRRVSNG